MNTKIRYCLFLILFNFSFSSNSIIIDEIKEEHNSWVYFYTYLSNDLYSIGAKGGILPITHFNSDGFVTDSIPKEIKYTIMVEEDIKNIINRFKDIAPEGLRPILMYDSMTKLTELKELTNILERIYNGKAIIIEIEKKVREPLCLASIPWFVHQYIYNNSKSIKRNNHKSLQFYLEKQIVKVKSSRKILSQENFETSCKEPIILKISVE